MSELNFSALKRKSRLPSPPAEASENLQAPELTSVDPPALPFVQPPPTPAIKETRPAMKPEAVVLASQLEEGASPKPPEIAHEFASEPIKPLRPVDGRARRATGRIHPFSTRVSEEFKPRLIAVADQLGCTMSEALEQALSVLETSLKQSR